MILISKFFSFTERIFIQTRPLWRVGNQPIEAFINCVAYYENFVVDRKASSFVSYVIKEFAHAFSCAYIELWMHLGSLESTQEAMHLSWSPKFPRASITRYTHAKHEQILNFSHEP